VGVEASGQVAEGGGAEGVGAGGGHAHRQGQHGGRQEGRAAVDGYGLAAGGGPGQVQAVGVGQLGGVVLAFVGRGGAGFGVGVEGIGRAGATAQLELHLRAQVGGGALESSTVGRGQALAVAEARIGGRGAAVAGQVVAGSSQAALVVGIHRGEGRNRGRRGRGVIPWAAIDVALHGGGAAQHPAVVHHVGGAAGAAL
nr:hypothetical protein [Tanacetum cinerariifolium]